jgi:hypothetical protein
MWQGGGRQACGHEGGENCARDRIVGTGALTAHLRLKRAFLPFMANTWAHRSAIHLFCSLCSLLHLLYGYWFITGPAGIRPLR